MAVEVSKKVPASPSAKMLALPKKRRRRAVEEGDGRSQRYERVHVAGPVLERAPGAGVELAAGPELHRRRDGEKQVVHGEGEHVTGGGYGHERHHDRGGGKADDELGPELGRVPWP